MARETNTILVTDTLFIEDEHVSALAAAGFAVERLPKTEASEAELTRALHGKVGYILGGIEKATARVLASATSLRAVVFAGADWQHFIPGHSFAKGRGIAIANTPGANKEAVAEYAITLMLAMVRNIFALGRTGTEKFATVRSLSELSVGIIGLGNIGSIVAKQAVTLGAKEVQYYRRTRKSERESALGISYTDLDTLLATSDIIMLHMSSEAGKHFIDAEKLAKMKDNALIINCSYEGAIDMDALYKELAQGRLRAAQDEPADSRFAVLPLSQWFCSNGHTAYNTHAANKKASDMAVSSIINLLKGRPDPERVL